jgi:hypothetical protein
LEEEIGNWRDHARLLGTGFGDRFKVLQGGSDGKEGVDGSSPSEGFGKFG